MVQSFTQIKMFKNLFYLKSPCTKNSSEKTTQIVFDKTVNKNYSEKSTQMVFDKTV